MNTLSPNFSAHMVCNMIKQDREQLEDMYAAEKNISVVVHQPKPAATWSRSYPECLHDLMDSSIAVVAGNRIMYPTSHAWAQIISKLGVPKNYFKMLLRTNIQLLVDNLNHCFRESENKNSRRLLRMRILQVENRSVSVLRAYLDEKHNRLDNIYVFDALIDLLSRRNYDFGPCRFDGDGFWQQINLGKKSLTRLHEQYAYGVDITNSEIGLTKGLELRALLTRLVCTNGMTVDEKGETIYLEPDYFLREHVPTHDQPHMPPAKLPDHVQRQINNAIHEAFALISSKHGTVLDKLDELALGMRDLNMSLGRPDQLRTAVGEVLQQSGIRYWGGVELDRIEESYRSRAEIETANHATDNAWGIINAITHYATHDLFTSGNKFGRQRHRNAEQLDILLGDILSYGHRIALQNNAQPDKKTAPPSFAQAFRRTGDFLDGDPDPDLRGELFLGERIRLSQRLQRSAFRLMQPRTVRWDRVQTRVSQLDVPARQLDQGVNVPTIRPRY